MIDLAGKVALITGAGRGIGRSIAEAMHGAGAGVGILDIDRGLAEGTAGEIGERACGVVASVTDADQLATAVAAVEEQLGPVDILVNNAGVTRDGLLVRMGEDDWDLVLGINLKGTFLVTKTLARGMMKRRWGRIINIASVVGIMGNAGQANYSASKAGVIGFTKTMARELASRNVLVNAIAPGFIDTEMTRRLSDEQREGLVRQIPLRRLGQPEDVARAALFLASDLADYITGQVLVIDGGMVM